MVPFADVGFRLISGIRVTVADKKQMKETIESAKSLSRMGAEIEEKSEAYRGNSASFSNLHALLLELCKECKSISIELQGLVQTAGKSALDWAKLRDVIKGEDSREAILCKRLAHVDKQIRKVMMACML